MFGLFGNKQDSRDRQELALLEQNGAAHSSDPLMRRRHAWLVHVLRSDLQVLPLYESIAADFPNSMRWAWQAAKIRLENGDPTGLEPMQRVAAACPSLAKPCYYSIVHFLTAASDEAGIERIAPAVNAAFDEDERAELEGRLIDPGGPLEPPRYDERDRAFIAHWLSREQHVRFLLAGSRRLDAGGSQQVLLVDIDPGADGELEVTEKVVELMQLYGDFVLYHMAPQWEWLEAELRAKDGGQLYP